MKLIKIYKKSPSLKGIIKITGSKSESNRLLILKAIYPKEIYIKNLSNSLDTKILIKSLKDINKKNKININNTGTAMRFLTAYFSIQKGRNIILTGSNRMKKRPIGILVKALRELGANISYKNKEGYPPIKIKGKKLEGGKICLKANISSQYISALMLIAPKLKKGLEIILSKKIISLPYIYMTYKLMKKIGINLYWKGRNIFIYPGKDKKKSIIKIESDWSSVSYYYLLSAVSKKSKLDIFFYKKKSLQGDSIISYIYKKYFGINTIYDFFKKKIILKKNKYHVYPKYIKLDLNKTPDIAQTIAVTCSILNIKCFLLGLDNLKIKETDRIEALKKELKKIGTKVKTTNNSLEILNFNKFYSMNSYIETYQDHRMAMAFSAISFKYPIYILNPNVVEKSYPKFWKDLEILGFSIF